MGIAAGLLHDGVYPFEPKAGNLAQAEETFPQKRHASRAKVLVNCHSRLGRNFERRQNGHQLPHSLALGIAGLDLLQPLLGNTPDFQQLFRVLLDDV